MLKNSIVLHERYFGLISQNSSAAAVDYFLVTSDLLW